MGVPCYLGARYSVWAEQGKGCWGLLEAPTSVEGNVWRSWIRKWRMGWASWRVREDSFG